MFYKPTTQQINHLTNIRYFIKKVIKCNRNDFKWGNKMIILDVNKLGKNFGYGKLFEDISFSLNEGESISIVGPNGCGKSTLLKMIAGIERKDTGTVSIKKGSMSRMGV